MAPRPLVFMPVAMRGRRFSVTPETDGGVFGEEAMAMVREAFAYKRDGSTREIHPRLVALVYRAVLHFEVPFVHVVSGYRQDRATSRHTQGRAVDMVLPGVSDSRLARYLRRQGFVGVGVYPVSGFVHLDVRARSYFWTDGSGPGRPTRGRPTLAAQTIEMDRRARRRGEVAVPDVTVGEDAGDHGGIESPDPSEGPADNSASASTEAPGG